MTWRLANALRVLRLQIDKRYPQRDKSWDGTIGDEKHASRTSDHNPWVDGGVVTAIDITHDPKVFDAYVFAEQLRCSRDPRIKYIISNGRICSSKIVPWMWRPYHGASKHDHHTHVSVESSRVLYDDVKPWVIPMLDSTPHSMEEIAKSSALAEHIDEVVAKLSPANQQKIAIRTKRLIDDEFERQAQKVEKDDV